MRVERLARYPLEWNYWNSSLWYQAIMASVWEHCYYIKIRTCKCLEFDALELVVRLRGIGI